MTFPMTKKNSHQLTFIAQAEIQVQEVSPKERKRKRNVNDVSNGKKKRISTERSKEHVSNIPKAKERRNLILTIRNPRTQAGHSSRSLYRRKEKERKWCSNDKRRIKRIYFSFHCWNPQSVMLLYPILKRNINKNKKKKQI